MAPLAANGPKRANLMGSFTTSTDTIWFISIPASKFEAVPIGLISLLRTSYINELSCNNGTPFT